MRTVAASEFSRNFGRYQDLAIREPIRVTSHGRVVGAYISAEDLERYERFAAASAEGRLEELLLEGVASGDPQPLDDADWASIRREVEEGIERGAAVSRQGRATGSPSGNG